MALSGDDPMIAEFNKTAHAVLELIDSSDWESGARLFVEQAVGLSAWEQMTVEEHQGMPANTNTGTFAGTTGLDCAGHKPQRAHGRANPHFA